MKNTDSRNTIYIAIIIVVLIITCAFSFTFAFIGSASGNGNVNVVGNILDASDALSLTYSGSTSLGFNITVDDFNIANSGTDDGVVEGIDRGDTASITVTLKTDSSFYPNGAKCNYSIEYHPTTVFVPSPGALAQGLTELSILSKDIGNVSNAIVLAEETIATSSSSSTNFNVHTLYYTLYNLEMDQSSLIGQSPSGKIVFVPGECEKL